MVGFWVDTLANRASYHGLASAVVCPRFGWLVCAVVGAVGSARAVGGRSRCARAWLLVVGGAPRWIAAGGAGKNSGRPDQAVWYLTVAKPRSERAVGDDVVGGVVVAVWWAREFACRGFRIRAIARVCRCGGRPWSVAAVAIPMLWR